MRTIAIALFAVMTVGCGYDNVTGPSFKQFNPPIERQTDQSPVEILDATAGVTVRDQSPVEILD